jgi:hypothetical protein
LLAQYQLFQSSYIRHLYSDHFFSSRSQLKLKKRVDLDEPEAKRRRRGAERLGSSVVRSATVLARTLVACEDKRERRHREVLELEERRLRLEAERNEVRRQGFAGLVAAVNGLSGAIHALVSSDHHHRSGDPSSR